VADQENARDDDGVPFEVLQRPGARIAVERARLWIARGEAARARTLLLKLWEERIGSSPLMNIATAELLAEISSADERVEWYDEALTLANAAGDVRSRRRRAPLYAALADAQQALGNAEGADEAWAMAQEVQRIMGAIPGDQ
jgi:hypothetical protein